MNYEWKITTLRQAQGDIGRHAPPSKYYAEGAQGNIGCPSHDKKVHVALSLSKGDTCSIELYERMHVALRLSKGGYKL